MGFKGTIQIKRVHLLNMHSNQKLIFQSNVSRGCKHIAWGHQMAIERILDGDYGHYSWDDFVRGTRITATLKPGEVFAWLFTIDETKKRA